jgi:putative PIN family toxin of toxin-antitoxin system
MVTDRVFVDTNVLLSGLIFEGNESRLLRLAIGGEIRLVMGEVVLQEARAVLQSKFPVYVRVLDDLLALLDYEITPRPDQESITLVACRIRHPVDGAVLASMISAGADYVITGDKDFFTEDVHAMIPVCRCSEYLKSRFPEAP